MKTTFNALFALIVMLALSLTAQAQKWVSGTSTDIGVTNTYYIARADLAGQPVVSYFSATSDKATSAIRGYSTAAPIPVTATVSVLDDTFVGTEGRPLLIDLDGTSASQINTITVEYKATR